MADSQWLQREAAFSLQRLLPRLEARFGAEASAAPDEWRAFTQRLHHEWERLFGLLVEVYGEHYDFFFYLEEIVLGAAQSWLRRPAWLKQRDEQRETTPAWFLSQDMIGIACYVDLLAEHLAGLRAKLPFFKDLGVSYIYLMPLFRTPEGKSDGGYAISDYREVNPRLGTAAELADIAREFEGQGISLVVDFALNYTSDEHRWALAAQAGEGQFQDFYLLFPDRTLPDAYERTLHEVFPEARRGSFTWREDMGKWAWTTFNSFQWDLNYANPAVFQAMAEEMLLLANTGVACLRLDAVAFLWKRMGTSCENQPEAHKIIQAFNALCRIAAPSLLFTSEAIMHPDDVLSYVSPQECQLSYNPLLMALLWEALATRETKLLDHSMRTRFALPSGTSWVNYLRSHDDIGWTFDNGDAQWEWIDPVGHRRFLNEFYLGRFPGSFARGVAFQKHPATGDVRISGTLASLAGLEQAVQSDSEEAIGLAVRRILMLHSVLLSIGGIPLMYLGDEIGTLNDYSYANDPEKASDSRWVHRSKTDWNWRAYTLTDLASPHGYIFTQLVRLIYLRKQQSALYNGHATFIATHNSHVFGYVRCHNGQHIVVLANFSEYTQWMDADNLRMLDLGYQFVDLVAAQTYAVDKPVRLSPYQCVWLQAQ